MKWGSMQNGVEKIEVHTRGKIWKTIVSSQEAEVLARTISGAGGIYR